MTPDWQCPQCKKNKHYCTCGAGVVDKISLTATRIELLETEVKRLKGTILYQAQSLEVIENALTVLRKVDEPHTVSLLYAYDLLKGLDGEFFKRLRAKV